MLLRWSVLSLVGVAFLVGQLAVAGADPKKPAKKEAKQAASKAESKGPGQSLRPSASMPGMPGMAGMPGLTPVPRGGGHILGTPSSGPATEKIRAALAGPTTMEFIETPLSDVVNYLRDLHQIEIQVDSKALNDVGVAPDSPIARSLKGLSLRSALNLILSDLDLAWVISNEVLLITTREKAESILETVVYDVHDLVAARDEKGSSVNDFDGLVDVITRTVAPVSWDQVGGPGSIAPFEGNAIAVLSVSQTPRIHEEIVRLLADLRKATYAKPGEPVILRTVRPASHPGQAIQPAHGGMGESMK